MRFRVYDNRLPKIATARLVLAIAILFAGSALAKPTGAQQSPASQVQTAQPQAEDGWTTIKTNDGILFVWNVGDLHFSLAIKGNDIKPASDPDHIFFAVDGRVLQIQAAAIKEFAPDAKEKKLDDRAILAAHRDWEAKFIEDLLHSKLRVQTFNVKLSSGGDASMWQFDMPQGMNADAQKQLYLTVVRGNFVVLINSEVTARNPEDEGRKFLLDTMATFKSSATPIDVKALAESIRADSKP